MFYIWNTAFTLQPGSLIHITSHNHPLFYPANAYVLWTFQFSSADNGTVYHISFGTYVRIQRNDLLKIGNGFDPNDPLSVIASYQGYYDGYPSDVVIPSSYIYVEFDADSDKEWYGFQMSVIAQNSSGEIR